VGRLESDSLGVVVTCESCGQKNRLSYDRLGSAVRCGRCHNPISAPATPLEAPGSTEFDRLIEKSSLPVVVDYWAPWCGPCRMVAPELEKVAARTRGQWLVVKVNTDALPELGERLGIRSIPTMAVFAEGREVGRVAGARPAADIEAFVRQSLDTRNSR
jgi:thioredoxin 2